MWTVSALCVEVGCIPGLRTLYHRILPLYWVLQDPVLQDSEIYTTGSDGPKLTRTHARRRMSSQADTHLHAFARIRTRLHAFARMHARSRQQPSSVAPAARQHVQLLDKELGRLALCAVEEADARVDQLTDQHVVGVVVLDRVEEAEEVEKCQLRSCRHTRTRKM